MKSIRLATAKDLHITLSDFYTEIAYDGSPEFSQYVPKGVWFVLFENNDIAGLINLEQMNNVMWNCHIMIYASHRGNGSEEWAKLVAQWAREHLEAEKFLAITPYEAAKKYAERAGFTNVGILSSSIRKNGKLLNQYVLELGEQQ